MSNSYLQGLSQETLAKAYELIGQAHAGNPLAKVGIDLATGLTGYNLDEPAKLLASFQEGFTYGIPSVSKPGGAANWKRITGVSRGRLAVAEGVAGNQITLVTDAKAVTYKSLSLGGRVTWESEQASKNYENARNRSETLTLLAFLQDRARMILGGNITVLTDPTAATPLKTVTTGGAIGTGTYKAQVSGLTAEGYAQFTNLARTPGGSNYDIDPLGSVAPNVALPAPAFVSGATAVPTIGCGPGTLSAASAAGAGSTNKLVLTWTAVPNAVAYIVWVDNGAGGALTCQCILPAQTKVQFLSLRTGAGTITAPASATDAGSASAVDFDGILPQLHAAGSGAYIKNLNATLSAASGIQIPELRDAMQAIWDKVRGIEVDRILTGPVEASSIDKILSSVTSDRIHVVYTPGSDGPKFEKTKYYPSPITGKQIPIEINADLPGGIILGLKDSVDLPDSSIPAAWAMQQGSAMMRIDYALTRAGGPNMEHEVRSFEALAGYAPIMQFAFYNVHPS